jgi:hypothetical protein
MTPKQVVDDFQHSAGSEYKVVADWIEELINEREGTALIRASLEELAAAATHALTLIDAEDAQ